MSAYSLLRMIALTGCMAAAPAIAAPQWVPTWVASQQPLWRPDELPLPTGLPTSAR